MNFKDWKKVKEDAKTVTMAHPSGHNMTLILKSLPGIQREQIKRLKLAEGGTAWEQDYPLESNQIGQINTQAAQSKPGVSQAGQKLRKGDKEGAKRTQEHVLENMKESAKKDRGNYATGGETVPPDDPTGGTNYSTDKNQYYSGQAKEWIPYSQRGQNMADANASRQPASDDSFDDKTLGSSAGKPSAHTTNVYVNASPTPPPALAQAAPAPAPLPQAASSTVPQAVSNPQVQLPTDTTPPVNAQALTNPAVASQLPAQGLQQASQAANAQQAIDTAKAQGNAAIAQEQQKNAQIIMDRQNQTIADMKGHTDAFAKYMNENPVDPMAFGHNMGAGQKTATALGLLFGGFSGGFSGTGNNPALNWLSQQQDKSINAQIQNREGQKNVWNAYQTLYGDENVSTNLTKVSMNDELSAQANMLAAKLATPQAAQANIALQAQLKQANAQHIYDAANNYMAARPMYGTGQPKTGGIANISKQPSSQSAQGQGPTVPGSSKGLGSLPESIGPDKDGIYTPKSILLPGASERVKSYAAVSSGPIAKNYPEIQKQFDAANRADTVLSQLPDQFRTLKANATQGGWLGRNNTAAGLAAAAGETAGGLGGLASGIYAAGKGALGDVWTLTGGGLGGENPTEQFAKNRIYESTKSRLYGDLTNALRGTNVTGEQIADIVNKNAPDYQDGPKETETKLRTIEMFVKNAARGPLLGGSTGLSREK